MERYRYRLIRGAEAREGIGGGGRMYHMYIHVMYMYSYMYISYHSYDTSCT